MIEYFSVNLNNYKRKTPAGDCLFGTMKLQEIRKKMKQEFHTMMTKGLFYANAQGWIFKQKLNF